MELKRFKVDVYLKDAEINFCSVYFDTKPEASEFILIEKRTKDYRYEIIDQTTFPEYCNAVAIENRKKEYPVWEEIIEALIDKEHVSDEKLQSVIQKRLEVKARYPKV